MINDLLVIRDKIDNEQVYQLLTLAMLELIADRNQDINLSIKIAVQLGLEYSELIKNVRR